MSKIDKIKILTVRDAVILSFVVDGMHPLDVGAMLGAHNICVRAGNMCASWVHKCIGVVGSVRMSIGAWNTIDDIKTFVNVVKSIVK